MLHDFRLSTFYAIEVNLTRLIEIENPNHFGILCKMADDNTSTNASTLKTIPIPIEYFKRFLVKHKSLQHNTILQIFQDKSIVLKNEDILSTEMLEGFYFVTHNRY